MIKLKKYIFVFAISAIIMTSAVVAATKEECDIFKIEKIKYKSDKVLTDMILSGKIDLKLNEDAGGHVIKKHVGYDEETLTKRLECEQKISASSSYNNIEQATYFIALALKNKHEQIKNFYETSKPNSTYLITEKFEKITGIKVQRKDTEKVDTRTIALVLKKIDTDLIILTSYPQ